MRIKTGIRAGALLALDAEHHRKGNMHPAVIMASFSNATVTS